MSVWVSSQCNWDSTHISFVGGHRTGPPECGLLMIFTWEFTPINIANKTQPQPRIPLGHEIDSQPAVPQIGRLHRNIGFMLPRLCCADYVWFQTGLVLWLDRSGSYLALYGRKQGLNIQTGWNNIYWPWFKAEVYPFRLGQILAEAGHCGIVLALWLFSGFPALFLSWCPGRSVNKTVYFSAGSVSILVWGKGDWRE